MRERERTRERERHTEGGDGGGEREKESERECGGGGIRAISGHTDSSMTTEIKKRGGMRTHGFVTRQRAPSTTAAIYVSSSCYISVPGRTDLLYVQ